MKKYSITDVAGAPGGNAYIIDNGDTAMLWDSGFPFSGGKMVENIRAVLGGRPLDYVLLSHSHYDHAGGSPFCKRAWPGVRVVAAPVAARAFTRPGALATMRSLNDSAAAHFGMEPRDEVLDELSVDLQVSEGDTVDVGGLRLRVLDTPGHTRDCLTFLDEETGLMLCSESLGTPVSADVIMHACLVGYGVAAESIKKAMACEPSSVLLSHWGLLTGDEGRGYLRRSLSQLEGLGERVCDMWKRGAAVPEITRALKKTYKDEPLGMTQPTDAFLINAGIMVPVILRELLGLTDEEIKERA